MPVKDVGRSMVAHVTVGDEAHVRILGSDGREEGNVVFYIPGFPAILYEREMSCCSAHSIWWIECKGSTVTAWQLQLCGILSPTCRVGSCKGIAL